MSINLLKFIKTMPLKTVNGVDMVLFNEISTDLKHQNGFGNKDILEAKLIELEKAGHFKTHREDDVLIGISF